MQNDAKNWTANQRKFMAWLAAPSKQRQPATQGGFAKEIGVVDSTLSRWKKEPGFGAEVGRLSKELLKGDLPEIYGALAREAKAGSFQHIKLALEVAGEHVDKQEIGGAATIRVVYDDGGGG